MTRRGEGDPTRTLLMIAAGVVIVAALYVAQDVLMPLALAVLLSFLLTPLVVRLERVGLWRVPAVLLVAGFAFTVLGGVGWLVAGQLGDLIETLPQYRHTIRERVDTLREHGGGLFQRATDLLRDWQEELAPRPDPFEAPEPEPAPEPAPETVPVEVVDPPPGPLEILRLATGPLITAGLVLIFTLFIMVQRELLRDRIIRLAGLGQIDVTTKALDDAGRRITRYLLAQVVINVSYGIPVAIGLWLIGLPNALLWGVLAMLVRFIPFIGPWVGALLPIAMSLAVFDDWTRPLIVIGMFVIFELFSNNVMEPWLYGTSTGISMFAVVVAVVFWTWLWGPVGLLLATPLTVCIMVLGKHVERLRFLDILLSDEIVLEPPSRLYQRLLAMDHDDATDLAEEYFAHQSLADVYDRILVPTLHLAERDRHRGRLDQRQQQFIHATMHQIVEHLGRLKMEAELLQVHTHPAEQEWRTTLERVGRIPIASLPARDQADELVAEMFAQVLAARGLDAHPITMGGLSSERLQTVAELNARIVCINALPPSAAMYARYLYKRLTQREPDALVVVGLWNFTGDLDHVRQRIDCQERDCVVTTFAEAVRIIRRQLPNLLAQP